MASPRLTKLLFAFLCTPLVGLAAERVTYCCLDDRGHRTCGDVLPAQCFNKSYRVISSKGITLQVVDAPLTAEQRAQREADDQKRKADERIEKEQRRRDTALLETYASDKEIDEMQQRVIRQHEATIKDIQTRKNTLLARQKSLLSEAEFYAKKTVPTELRTAIKDNEVELRAAEDQIQARRKEIESTRIRFEEEKRRFIELKRRGANLPVSMSGAMGGR